MPPTPFDPVTPRNRPRVSGSPLTSSLPFDWDAAIHRRPPPYGTPASQRKLRNRSSIGVGNPASGGKNGTPISKGAKMSPRRVFRKVPVTERISNWTSQMIYDIQDLPRNRLPELRSVARVLGAVLHITHLVVRYTKLRRLKDEDIGWEDMLGEIDIPGAPSTGSWVDWTTLASMLLVTISILNGVYLFTRIKYYHFFHRSDLVSSVGAELVDRDDLDRTGHPEPPPVISRILSQSAHLLLITWCFLFGTKPPTPETKASRRVQRLSVWAPEEGEMALFITYSPLHALLWQAVSPGNWIIISLLLGLTSAQLFTLNKWYRHLLKDKELIAGEVMHEYDEKFVYPHIMRVRRDVGVMTNEAEVVSFYR
ncbi:hypothetical protein JB92DRAFT_3142437 [Gautieria morchelliformis]|nr:hypothetical protein JB92DRAFT_3142437 [Gautieria morchelliformis]